MIPVWNLPFGRFSQQPADQLPLLLPRLTSGKLRLPEAEKIIEEACV